MKVAEAESRDARQLSMEGRRLSCWDDPTFRWMTDDAASELFGQPPRRRATANATPGKDSAQLAKLVQALWAEKLQLRAGSHMTELRGDFKDTQKLPEEFKCAGESGQTGCPCKGCQLPAVLLFECFCVYRSLKSTVEKFLPAFRHIAYGKYKFSESILVDPATAEVTLPSRESVFVSTDIVQPELTNKGGMVLALCAEVRAERVFRAGTGCGVRVTAVHISFSRRKHKAFPQ